MLRMKTVQKCGVLFHSNRPNHIHFTLIRCWDCVSYCGATDPLAKNTKNTNITQHQSFAFTSFMVQFLRNVSI